MIQRIQRRTWRTAFWTAIGFEWNTCESGRSNAERLAVREPCEMIPYVSKTCVHEEGALPSRRRSSARCPRNNRSHQQIRMGYCHTLALLPRDSHKKLIYLP
ncbi:hypothetical protein Trydic_g2032 [Trypoxylus dichotomus]